MSAAAAAPAPIQRKLPSTPTTLARDAIVAFSLANLWFVRTWSEFLTYSAGDTYLMKSPPPPAYYLGLVFDVLLLTAVFWGGIRFARSAPNRPRYRIAQWLFLASLVVPVNGFYGVIANRHAYLRSPMNLVAAGETAIIYGVVTAAGLIVALCLWRARLVRLGAHIMVLTSPFGLITCGQALWKAAHYSGAALRDRPTAPFLAGAKATPRVVWLIADEWDYRLTFVDRNASVHLPEIDRLRKQALFAAAAFSPAGMTMSSLPSLIAGKKLENIEPLDPTTLLVQAPGASERVSFTSLPNVFSRARESGFDTAVVGWYLPYCRNLQKDLSACAWWPFAVQPNSYAGTLPGAAFDEFRGLFETTRLSLFGRSLATEHAVRTYREWLERASGTVADARFGMVFLHAPVPHSPHAFSRATGRFTRANSRVLGYLDSLVLLDRTIGSLRASLERAGLWDSTTVVVSSDHPFREGKSLDGKTDPRVPFILKLAYQKQELDFSSPFQTVLTADLLLDVLNGKIVSPQDAREWIASRPADLKNARN